MEKQQIGMFLFKCRKCGKEYHSTLESDWKNIIPILVETTIKGNSNRSWGHILNMVEIHSCGNDEFGVSDLIGAVKVEEG